MLADFLPTEPTEAHATVPNVPSGSASGSTTRSCRKLACEAPTDDGCQLEMQLRGARRKEFVISIDTAHVRSADQHSARNFELVVARCASGGTGRKGRSLFLNRQHRPSGNPRSCSSPSPGGRISRIWGCDGDLGRGLNPKAAAPRHAETNDPHHRPVSYCHGDPANAADRRSHRTIPIRAL
ncbi:hypothetical protein ACVWW4_004242 [Bradyrhizobium sp. LB7.1]